jgi:hypothetical protein
MEKAYDVDLFVNGGSNTFLYNGINILFSKFQLLHFDLKLLEFLMSGATGPLGEKVQGPYPIVSYSQSVKRLFVQTNRYGKYLGKIEMTINDEGRIIGDSKANPILLNSTVEKSSLQQFLVYFRFNPELTILIIP